MLRNLLFCGLLALASASAQNPVITQIIPSDTIRLDPTLPMVSEFKQPKIYNRWLKTLTECEGVPMPPQEELDRLQFLVVNSELFKTDSASSLYYGGVAFSRHHLIILALPYINDSSVVKHELMHFVLWYDYGDKYTHNPYMHSDEYFTKCSLKPSL